METDPNDETRDVWNANAAFWDGRMGEGNDFVNTLTWPATQRLLALKPGEKVLDLACGNGLTSRRMASLGVEVIACDFADKMVEYARRYPQPQAGSITYHVIDATDESALTQLAAPGSFDAALCAMAFFDMAEIEPAFRAIYTLLRPGGRFVFSVLHPCFNNPHADHFAEMRDNDGNYVTLYGVKVWGYQTPFTAYSAAIVGQPRAQLVFHRPIQVLFDAGFKAGFVVDGLEERAFPPDHPPGRNPIGWGANLSEIPPALVARMRK
jgi:2-polyprenyl-3-methyl-5-hydroxy-6-metoxy-1,4-benzoquinol methylase